MKRKIENKKKININLKNSKMYILSGVCGVLAVLSIFMTIESATSGSEVASIQKQEAALLNQQQDLQAALVQSISVNSLQKKSFELGFVKADNLVYVANTGNDTGGVPVARLP